MTERPLDPADRAGPVPAALDARFAARPPVELVVIAASAGGIAALQRLLGSLPAELPASIAIVQHRSVSLPNLLPRVLGRATPLPVRLVARELEPIAPGTVYVAPADRHLVVEARGRFATFDGQRILHLRSAANPLFSSAAAAYGRGVLAVVLTGGDGDAAAGAQAVKAAGGFVIVQDPATADNPAMPLAALATGAVDLVLPLEEIAPAIVAAVRRDGG